MYSIWKHVFVLKNVHIPLKIHKHSNVELSKPMWKKQNEWIGGQSRIRGVLGFWRSNNDLAYCTIIFFVQ